MLSFRRKSEPQLYIAAYLVCNHIAKHKFSPNLCERFLDAFIRLNREYLDPVRDASSTQLRV